MKTPCNKCPRYLTCPNHRACAAWFWWWADRWREAAERIAEMAEMEGWL